MIRKITLGRWLEEAISEKIGRDEILGEEVER